MIWVGLALAALTKPQAASETSTLAISASSLLDQMANQHDWGDADRIRAENLSKSVNELWFVCLGKAELRLRYSKEAVGTIATAVLGSCASEEQLYVRSLRSVFRGRGPVEISKRVSQIDTEAREKAREAITTYLVNYRLSPPQPPKK